MSQMVQSIAEQVEQRATRRRIRRQERRRARREQMISPQQPVYLPTGERVASVAAGAILAAFGLSRRNIPGALAAGIGGVLVYRGLAGQKAFAPREMLEKMRAEQPREISEYGIHVQRALLINKSPEELYRFWRDFENLPRVLKHLDSVRVYDERRSHWAARAPRVLGGTVEWDAEVTHDEPNARIAWRSLPGGDVRTVGEIRFTRARGDRGTEVRAFMDYLPPAGRLGRWLAALFGHSPQRMFEDDLRNFKVVMECGEAPTIVGQPHGTCTGLGKKRTE